MRILTRPPSSPRTMASQQYDDSADSQHGAQPDGETQYCFSPTEEIDGWGDSQFDGTLFPQTSVTAVDQPSESRSTPKPDLDRRPAMRVAIERSLEDLRVALQRRIEEQHGMHYLGIS